MQAKKTMIYLTVFLGLLGCISCQSGTGTNSDSCAVTATSLGCANYRVLTLVSKNSNFLRVNPDGSFTGFLWDLLNALKETLPFEFTLSPEADGVYGGRDAHGAWNGLVGQLVRNATDMVIADFTITSERLEAVDYTVPFMPYHLVIVSRPNASLTGIKYAVKGSSSAFTYLRSSRESRAQKIWTSVLANQPTSLVHDDDAGLALVQQGGWAFVTADAAVAVAVKNSRGQLVISRPALHTFYYALGVQLDSPLRIPLSIAVTKMMAKGQIQQLLTKWDLAA